MRLVDEILKSSEMRGPLSSLSKEEIQDLREWMAHHLIHIDTIREGFRDMMSTEDGVDTLTDAVEYIFSKEGASKWQEKN